MCTSAQYVLLISDNDPMNTLPEWTDLRFFLELARAGTLSGASRRLEVEHTTVARRIDRLEAQLGTTLFDRSREGYELTEMGQALLPHAEAMESAALAANDQLSGAEVAAHGRAKLRLLRRNYERLDQSGLAPAKAGHYVPRYSSVRLQAD